MEANISGLYGSCGTLLDKNSPYGTFKTDQFLLPPPVAFKSDQF
jgi:hypothetical protein